MAGAKKQFIETGGIESFEELMLFLLSTGKLSNKQLTEEFEKFNNKISAAYTTKILNLLKNSSIHFLMEEHDDKLMKSNGAFTGVKTYTLVEDAKKIDSKDLVSLVGNNLLSAYDIFVKKYPTLESYFDKTLMIDDYHKPEVNLPPKTSLCEIIIYCLYHKGQLQVRDIVKIINKLYEPDLYNEKDVMRCFRDMSKKMIFNLLSKLDITKDGRYTYFLKKQIFSDRVKYEELKELCDITDINDFRIADFLNKYKNLQRYFANKTKVKLSHSDLSKNHLIEMIFFVMLLNNTNTSLSTDMIFEKVCELDDGLAKKYDVCDIDSIFEEFEKHPVKHMFIQHASVDNHKTIMYAIRAEAIECKIVINDLFDLYLTDRGAIKSFCEKYPDLQNLFPTYDSMSPVVLQETEEMKESDEDDVTTDSSSNFESQNSPDESVHEATCTEDCCCSGTSSFEGQIDGKFERSYDKSKKKESNDDTSSDPIDSGNEEDVSMNDISDVIKGIVKDIQSDRIIINITVNGNLIINN